MSAEENKNEDAIAVPEETAADVSTPEKQMTFLEHLEELRQRLIRAVVWIFLLMIIGFVFSDQIIRLLLDPILFIPTVKKPLEIMRPVITTVPGLMVVKLEIGLITGIILAAPVIVYQLWKFVAPGLMPKEKRYALPLVFFTGVCFLLGALFAYFVLIPISLNFLLSLGEIYNNAETGQKIVVENMIDVGSYVSFIMRLMLAMGIMFEMPMLSFFLSKVGLLTPQFMRKYWRHTFILILILSAILTPPDVISQVIMSGPLMVIYEISIWISRIVTRKRRREMQETGA